MTTYVILLRGVMPVGKNKVPMAELRAALAKAGFQNVQTYIQSGNVLADSERSRAEVEARVHEVIKKNIGADIAVMARTAKEFSTLVARNPFADQDPARVYFTLLAAPPAKEALAAFSALDLSPEKTSLRGDMLYTLYATRYGDSKFTNNFFEGKLKVKATTRNFNTMTKLVALSTR